MITMPRLSGAAKAGAILSVLIIGSLPGSPVARMAASPVQEAMVRDPRREPATPATPGTATISGTVASSDAGRPVRRATVRMSSMSAPVPPLQTTTDDEGRFAFEGVSAGRVTLAVSKPGYLESLYGQRRPGSGGPGTELSVADGQRIDRLVLPLARGGVLAGTVTDDRGEPAFGTDVRAFRYVGGTDVRLIDLEDALGAPARATTAGPDGAFAFNGVPPGRYRVEARAGRQQHIVVDQVGGRTRVMMTMNAARSDGANPPVPAPGGPPMSAGGAGAERPLWAAAEVFVADRDTPAVVLQLEPGVTVSGRVRFDSSAQPPEDPSSIRIVLNAASRHDVGAGSATGQVAEDGTFTIADVMPGRYRISVLGQARWRAKSFEVAGQDALDTLLDVQPQRHVSGAELSLTTRLATLSGALRETSGQPATAYTVVLFSEDAAHWTPQSRRVNATRPGTDGRFTIANLPAGRYRMAALDDVQEGRWFDPAFLAEIAPLSIAVTLADGEARVQDVQLAR